MRRGRGKRKRQNASAREDGDEEEKIPAYRRRGRPQKPVKDETEGEEEEIVEKDEDTNGLVTSKEDVTENGKKPVEESKESNVTEEENVLGSKSSTDDSVKSSLSTGFRQIGSRRKNKPRRAAEAVVECNGV
ncbi:hypothetical protein Bca4012_031329 [Brassica carinata]|uniref:Uncharacterized protein n=4 Tax=Brassica TaxID=3705 RepID=A0A0D3BX53_BRAOL|nr:PREDICTED: uncharacterized protein LOC106342357 [Brassica oleracea var. oleracea]XP_022562116.1 cilia- and flagella-associated protein 251 [Brassica napus]KAG2287837.1 hypothetical protein Bca52824_047441 [Brassica carinata]VDD09556.1 unnamed protein product [Brassica oleracea]CAF1848598.1 unnamed protein product [Brassica napus]CDY47653.1 BnaC04g23900D [Brassica napus]